LSYTATILYFTLRFVLYCSCYVFYLHLFETLGSIEDHRKGFPDLSKRNRLSVSEFNDTDDCELLQISGTLVY